MLKFILVAATVILFLIFSIPVLVWEAYLGKKDPEKRDWQSLHIVQWIFRIILKMAGVHITVKGIENIPKDKAVLYVGNHRSYFDIVITYSRVPDLTGYIAKKEMLRWPLLVNWMKNLHCLFLDRQDVKQGLKTILTAIDKVKAGISICIFPEGTRNRVNDTFMEFHEGSFKVASKSGCAVIPMAIYNSAAIFEDHIPWIKKATVIVEYGKPFYIKDLPKETQKRVGAYSRDLIMENYFRLKEEAKENGYG